MGLSVSSTAVGLSVWATPEYRAHPCQEGPGFGLPPCSATARGCQEELASAGKAEAGPEARAAGSQWLSAPPAAGQAVVSLSKRERHTSTGATAFQHLCGTMTQSKNNSGGWCFIAALQNLLNLLKCAFKSRSMISPALTCVAKAWREMGHDSFLLGGPSSLSPSAFRRKTMAQTGSRSMTGRIRKAR